jgi:hypothetical protein
LKGIGGIIIMGKQLGLVIGLTILFTCACQKQNAAEEDLQDTTADERPVQFGVPPEHVEGADGTLYGLDCLREHESAIAHEGSSAMQSCRSRQQPIAHRAHTAAPGFVQPGGCGGCFPSQPQYQNVSSLWPLDYLGGVPGYPGPQAGPQQYTTFFAAIFGNFDFHSQPDYYGPQPQSAGFSPVSNFCQYILGPEWGVGCLNLLGFAPQPQQVQYAQAAPSYSYPPLYYPTYPPGYFENFTLHKKVKSVCRTTNNTTVCTRKVTVTP